MISSSTRLVFHIEQPHCKIILKFKVLGFESSLNSGITGPVSRSDALMKWANEVGLVDGCGHSYYVFGQTRVSA